LKKAGDDEGQPGSGPVRKITPATIDQLRGRGARLLRQIEKVGKLIAMLAPAERSG
jgi:hypothetical protein